jgi:flagellar basal body-associated protein FliL
MSPLEKKMRRRAFILMLLPLIIILWVIGWSLFFIGSKTEPKTTTQTATAKDDGIEIAVIRPEEITAQTD